MTWIAIRLFMGKALGKAFDLVRRYPLQIALIVALIIVCLQQSRLSSVRQALANSKATIADMQAKAKRARETSVTIAKESDQTHEKRLTETRSRTDAFIAANRVRTEASAKSADQATGAFEATAPVSIVVQMPETDVRACGDLEAYAWSSYEWAQKLKAAGLAD